MRTAILSVLLFITIDANAHVPFLKPNQFILLHDRVQIESSFTEFPFQPDFAMNSPRFSMIYPTGKEIVIAPVAKTRSAVYLEPEFPMNGTYRINSGVRKGPKYQAIETADGKLYFASDTLNRVGKRTSLQYYSSADTYLLKGQSTYTPRLLNQGVEIIPMSSPNGIKTNDKVQFRVYKNGKPVPNARIVLAYDNEYYERKRSEDLYDVENTRAGNLYADKDGVVTFIPKKAGLVLLFVTIHDKMNDGLWESYNSSLTLEVNLPL
jgi:uncharacterized GH25 family protein